MKMRLSIKQKFLFFSIALFSAVLIGGSIAFFVAMQQIVHTNKENELRQIVAAERSRLEASVGGEIALALKMANSPLIRRYFQNPADTELESIAFEEIAEYRRAFKGNSVFWVNDIDHIFYSDDTPSYVVNPSDPANDWYQLTMYETKTYNFNINYNPDLNVTNLWINAPVFDTSQKPVGIVGTGIDITAFVDSIYAEFTADAIMYFFNYSGEITGAEDSSLVAEKMPITALLGATGTDILDRAQNIPDTETSGVRRFSTSDGVVAVGMIPSLDWYITVISPLTMGDYLGTPMTFIFAAMMAVIAVIFIVFFIFISGLLKPLNSMIQNLDEISENWDLTRKLKIEHHDETGNLGEFLNTTFDRMGGLIKNIKGKAHTLLNTSDELSSTMDNTAQAIGTINKDIQAMRGVVTTQTNAVTTTAASMEQIIGGLNKLNENVTAQVEVVAQSSSAVEQMLANIASVTGTLKKNADNINTLASSSEAGRQDLQKVSQDVQDIANESEGLLEINSVMQSIASQTNLLAMNAAIEAAHAGESGKGFAVVADEIRKLAENSASQSKTISVVLKKIKASIDTIMKSTSQVLTEFSTIEQEVIGVSNQEIRIRDAMEEQGIGSRHILEAITRLNAVTGEVERSSSEMAKTSSEALKQTGILRRVNKDVEESMDDMTASSDVITAAVTKIHGISRENKDNINLLSTEIARFKVE